MHLHMHAYVHTLFALARSLLTPYMYVKLHHTAGLCVLQDNGPLHCGVVFLEYIDVCGNIEMLL